MASEDDTKWLLRKVERMRTQGYSQDAIAEYASMIMTLRGTFVPSWHVRAWVGILHWCRSVPRRARRLWGKVTRKKMRVRQVGKRKTLFW